MKMIVTGYRTKWSYCQWILKLLGGLGTGLGCLLNFDLPTKKVQHSHFDA